MILAFVDPPDLRCRIEAGGVSGGKKGEEMECGMTNGWMEA